MDVVKPEHAVYNDNARRINVNPEARYLDEHLLRTGRTGSDLIFARSDGRPFQSTSAAKRASNAWEKVGLEGIGLHEARHTFASLMIAAGVNAKALSTYMGHANISITLDRYGHLMPGNEAEAAGLLDAYLERANTTARVAALG